MMKAAQNRTIWIVTVVAGITLVFFALAFAVWKQKPADAAVSGWIAGNIMDDSIMANKGSMSAAQIQSFLNNKVPTCDTKGTKTSEYGGGIDYNKDGRITRSEWARSETGETTFTCLKNYKEGGKSAAQIIYDVAQKYSINPQVILVLIQKEQRLVTDDWPMKVQYQKATGYGCPDTAACNTTYYGFTNQISWAAKMFRAILDASPTWYTPYTVGNNYILYNPSRSCGGSTVNIANRATQALYNYTPYQPNKASLAAGWGSASCGAYGNRNFFLFFNSWFGSTRAKYTSLLKPRWMQLANNTYKKIPGTTANIDQRLTAGTQLSFVDKIQLNGKWFYRTKHDYDRGINKGILATDVVDIPYAKFLSPRWIELKTDAYKYEPSTGKKNGVFKGGSSIYFESKITVNGKEYFRTKHDSDRGINLGFQASQTKDIQPISFLRPRYMEAKVNAKTWTINLSSPTINTTGKTIKRDNQTYYDTKILIGENWYARVPGSASYVLLDDLSDISYEKMVLSRDMILKEDVRKVIPDEQTEVDSSLSRGQKIAFTSKTTVNGKVYLRTKHDAERGLNKGILLTSLEELSAR